MEPASGHRGSYQIVCGEQRWRAAKAAGLLEILVRIHPHLGYLERLEKQYEENRLRADLDLVEEAHCILLDKTIRDIAVASGMITLGEDGLAKVKSGITTPEELLRVVTEVREMRTLCTSCGSAGGP